MRLRRQRTQPWENLLRQHDAMLFRRMSRLFSKASLHGVNRVCEPDTCCRPSQLTWSLILLLATIGMCVHIWSEVTEYRHYPVSSSSRLELNSFMFPSVTFCNPENPIKTRTLNQSALGAANDKLQSYSGVWDDPKIYPLYRLEHFVNFTKIGTHPEDVIAYCRYNRQQCSFRNFSLSFDRSYGNCFTFVPEIRKLHRPEIESGLILILYNPAADTQLEKGNYVGKMGYKMRPSELAFDTESFLISLHGAGTIPHPVQNSYPASTGLLNTVALKQRNTSLADTPNRPCQPRKQFPMFDSQLQQINNYTDTLYDCATWRDTMNIFKLCGCVPEGLIRLSDFPNPSSIPFCHLLTRKEEILNESQLIETIKPYELLEQSNISMQVLRKKFPEVYKRYLAFRCFHNQQLQPDVTCSDMCESQSYSAVLTNAKWPHPPNLDSDDSVKQMIEISLLLQEYLDSNDVQRALGGMSLIQQSLKLRNLNLSWCHSEISHAMLDTPDLRASNATQEALRRCLLVHDFVARHFLLVKVYPQTLTVDFLTIERSFQLPQLLSRVGGSLGLWVGTSLITFFECFEMLSTLASYFAAKSLHMWMYHRDSKRSGAADCSSCNSAIGTAVGTVTAANRWRRLRNGRAAALADGGGCGGRVLRNRRLYSGADSQSDRFSEQGIDEEEEEEEEEESEEEIEQTPAIAHFVDNLFRESHV